MNKEPTPDEKQEPAPGANQASDSIGHVGSAAFQKQDSTNSQAQDCGATLEPHQEQAPKRGRFQANKRYFTICIYAIVTFCICIFIYKFINNWKETQERISGIFSMLTPFLLAFLIAYFVNPLIRNIDKILERLLKNRLTRLHRVLSLVLAYVILIGFISLVLTFVIPQIGASIMELIGQTPSMYSGIEKSVNDFIAAHPDMNLESIQQFVDKNLPNIFEYAQDFMSSIVPMIYNAGLSIISWFINIILAFVISCYLMWDKLNLLRAIKRIIYAVFSENTAKQMINIIKKCNDIFSSFIIGKAIDSLIIGILCFIIMCILRLPYAVLISVIVGITNMIPYFGPFIGAVPGALLLLIISPRQALIFIIMVFLLQQFDGSILGPKILGDSTGLQPIWIIFAITVGGYTAGVVGMFLGVPITAVIAYLLNTFVDYILKRRHLSTEIAATLEKPQKDKEQPGQNALQKRLKKILKKK